MIKFSSNKGVLIDTISVTIKIWKLYFAIYLGKEGANAEENKQKLKNIQKSQSNDALA
tara:strand:- start:2691 stop:2864 length:174 start_codon:yes stop_codon:yes gene_type:complete